MIRCLLALSVLTSCYLKQFPVVPAVADTSVYETWVEAEMPGMVLPGTIQGTSWVVDKHHLVTAGHMCEWSVGDFTIESTSGRKQPAKKVSWELGKHADLCLLQADGDLAVPLVVAWKVPKAGTPMAFVGYPQDTHIVGHGVVIDATHSSAPMDHGASGSPVFTPQGVFGVLVQICEGEETGAKCEVFVPVTELRDFLKDAGVTPTDPPDAIPADFTFPTGE